jgi:hypothetical protein
MADKPPDGAAIKDASQQFVGVELRKEFAIVGFVGGRVIAHIPPNSSAGKDDVDNDQSTLNNTRGSYTYMFRYQRRTSAAPAPKWVN